MDVRYGEELELSGALQLTEASLIKHRCQKHTDAISVSLSRTHPRVFGRMRDASLPSVKLDIKLLKEPISHGRHARTTESVKDESQWTVQLSALIRPSEPTVENILSDSSFVTFLTYAACIFFLYFIWFVRSSLRCCLEVVVSLSGDRTCLVFSSSALFVL